MPSALSREIGQLLIVGFDGQQIPIELRSLVREFGLGGVILFARNIVEPEQVAELSAEAARLDPDIPLWVSVDQEGGRVARLKAPFTEWPPMASLGRSGDPALAARFARALATELRAVGITLDYAPVLDVFTNSRNTVIGDRALADEARTVATLGCAIIEALQEAGVAACGKHFPGHGDTVADSHFDLPLVEHPPDRIRGVELIPFRAAVKAGVAAIMTAHILVPSLDEEYPATLSRRVITGMLREELGFEGLIISDDLEMKAVSARYEVPEAAVLSIAAGCDGLLICSGDHQTQAATLERLVRAVEEERLSRTAVMDSLRRHRHAKERFLKGQLSRPGAGRGIRSVVGRDEHQAIAHEMAQFA